MTARRLRESIDLTKPESRSLADFLGREERIERSFQYRRRHPGAGIAHRDHDIGPGCQLGVVGGVLPVVGHVPGLDRDPPATRHRVPVLMTRLSTAASNCAGSICAGARTGLSIVTTSICSPMTRCIRFSILTISWFKLTVSGRVICFRA